MADIVIALAKKYQIPAIRLPLQGLRTLKWRNSVMAGVMLPWVIRLQKKLRQSGIAHNQEIFGLYESGAMLENTWLRLIPQLRPGVTEIFCHPAAKKISHLAEIPSSYHHEAEFEALISLKVKDRLKQDNIKLTCFAEMTG